MFPDENNQRRTIRFDHLSAQYAYMEFAYLSIIQESVITFNILVRDVRDSFICPVIVPERYSSKYAHQFEDD